MVSEIIALLHSHVPACRDTFVFYATDRGVSVSNNKIFITPDPQDISSQLRQKAMTLCRRNERCQRPKTS